jgi:hypothetical protein
MDAFLNMTGLHWTDPPPLLGPGCVFWGVSFIANIAPLSSPPLSLNFSCEKKEKKSRFVQ